MPPSRAYRIGRVLGSGGYSIVFHAEDEASGAQVAVKKSRVSQKVLRPHLQHESRVLSLLQGHPAIPAIYAYGHLPHFEYLAIELLGPTIRECLSGPVSATTAARVVLQVLSALEHIHDHGLVHRDIKPRNILCSPKDPSRIILIDFGMCRCIKPGPPNKYDPFLESKHLVGTNHWASLNSHNGIELSPRDDLESLAYIALFLVRGDLPWRVQNAPGNYDYEPEEKAMERVRVAKTSVSGAPLCVCFPHPFGDLLDYSRRLDYNQLPDYAKLTTQFESIGCTSASPLDWRSVGIAVTWVRSTGSCSQDSTGEVDEVKEYDEYESESYGDLLGNFENQGERGCSLTLPAEQAVCADGDVPRIVGMDDPSW